ncbi:AcrR family transcriptional regulator [Actinokineospora baliensis]|uniref:TetR/AcrR family transcriptional regulator n=1 Tax=Actinokineospora baliensis TaxID=547056 RepID=UPI00195B0989|nr:TetR/AcrR family transcriptional regulator [Actinokineospora baliensis]MBM7770856.1 AcrR family transcriptional regulator [Actinokineospora baliensis]
MAEYVIAGGGVVHERADAARNRRRILVAARALFSQRGVDRVTMDQIAAAAGVGKGTLFRRFGDKSGLAAALLDDGERELRGRVAEGDAPLGPGVDPAARLVAFFDAYLTFLTDHLDLVHLAETARPGTRYRIAAYRYWHAHVTQLLTAAGAAGDRESLAHVLLAGVAADLQRAVRAEVTAEGMRASVLHVVDAAVNAQLSTPVPVVRAAEAQVEPVRPSPGSVVALTPGTSAQGASLWVQEG